MALNANALTTVSRLREWLSEGLTATNGGRFSDERLTALINGASAAIEAWCDRVLVAPAQPVTYTFDGDGGEKLVLPDWPIVAVSTLTVDGRTVPARSDPLGVGYVVRPYEGWLALVGETFGRGTANVVVQARLGYDATLALTDRRHRRALADLEQACLLLAALWFEKPAAARLASTVGTHATRYADGELPAEVRGLLAPYRRWGV
jgi:hypothetical protein